MSTPPVHNRAASITYVNELLSNEDRMAFQLIELQSIAENGKAENLSLFQAILLQEPLRSADDEKMFPGCKKIRETVQSMIASKVTYKHELCEQITNTLILMKATHPSLQTQFSTPSVERRSANNFTPIEQT